MGSEYTVLIIGYIFGFYMAWNIGANDVANSMASAVGAKAITIRQAVFIAGILNIVGAVFIGSHVTKTIRKGIVSTDILADPHLALIGALSALFGCRCVGVFCHLEIAAGVHNPFHCGCHDRFWYHGRRIFGDQLGQTRRGGSKLGDFPGICHGHWLFDV